MSYNREFEDTMDNINNIAYGHGFKNGIEWASAALNRNEIDYGTYKKYENAHNLRVRFSHGNARDISVSCETYQTAREWESKIQYSSIRGNRNNSRVGNGAGKKTPKLPDGTFRGKPFVKEFKRIGKDGEEYFFKFAIYKENNYLDDGQGGTNGFGYFIHIENAPYFQYASNKLHEFHMIKTSYDYHICWNKIIENFDEANAVMYVWVNRYAELIDVLKNDNLISEHELNKRANKKHVLPSGTFRFDKKHNKKSYHIKTIYINHSIYNQIMDLLGKSKPELGGMLGFTLDQDTIDNFVFDEGARVNSVEYNPDIEYLQKIIDGEWEEKHIFLGGFVHSHPGDFNRLSYADVEYAQRIMNAFDLNYLFMPIVTSSYEYKTSITGYIVRINGKVDRCNIKVVPGQETIDSFYKTEKKSEDKIETTNSINPELLKLIENGFDEMDKKYGKSKTCNTSINDLNVNEHLSQDETFARISGVMDIPYMSECSIIGVGCGGSKSFYESMARMGVGNFYLIDGDKASKSNIASQNGYISEIGMYKPELIKKRILDINDKANVICFNLMLDDKISDEQLENDIISKIDVKKSVLCAFTDDFFAQARTSRIALKYGIPFICGQHHEGGTISEVIFRYPGITKYSLREIAKSRYKSYENGYQNSVTSVGSPIFNTTRLNALCEKIAIGLLLYNNKPDHEYCSFINLKSDRNLILIKQKFITEDNPLYDFFDNSVNSLFDEVVWINPESIEDLTDVVLEENDIVDTRVIFKTMK